MNIWAKVEKDAKKALPLIQQFIEMNHDKSKDYPVLNLTDMGLTAYGVWQLLEKDLGYEQLTMGGGGWEQSFWISFEEKNKEDKYFLQLVCCGMTNQIELVKMYS